MNGLGRAAECELYVRGMLDMSVRLWGRMNPFHVDIRTGLQFLVQTYKNTGDTDKVVALLKEVCSHWVALPAALLGLTPSAALPL